MVIASTPVITVKRCSDFRDTGNYAVMADGQVITHICRDMSFGVGSGWWYEVTTTTTSPYPYALGFTKAGAIAAIVKRITADTL